MGDRPAFRRAGAEDARALMLLEREANLVALGHVFPAAEHPFPSEAVRARWVDVLADPDVTVELVDGDEGRGPEAYAAHDVACLRHLAVRPDAWGRGLGRLLVARAVERMGPDPRLWCLVDNQRARSLYEHLGWRPTGAERAATWPPYPREMEYAGRGS